MDTAINKITKLVAIYARVSTGRQEEEETVKNQLMVLRELAVKNGWTIVKEYVDEGWSGDVLARPELDQLRADAPKKIWEAVLAYDPDRIARRYSYQALVMDELKDLGLEITFVTVASPKNSEEKIMHGVRGLFAEYERVKITERFRIGKLRKAKEGHLLVSEAKYGYDYVPKVDKKHGYYTINETEKKNINLMFSLVDAEKLTIRKLIKRLQELGIPPRKSKRGVWSTSTLSTLLHDKTYIGEAHFLRSYGVVPENPYKKDVYKKHKKTSRKLRSEDEWIKIPVPAIVDKDLFDKVQKILKENFELNQRNKKNSYLLSGKIRCVCGCTRAGEGPQQGKHLYYRCTDRVHRFPLPPVCLEKGINARVADSLVWGKLSELMTSPTLIVKQAEKNLAARNTEDKKFTGSVDEIKKEIEKLRKEEDRYLKAYGAEVITMEQLSAHTGEIRNKVTEKKKEILEIEQQEQRSEKFEMPSEEELKAFCQNGEKVISLYDFNNKRKTVLEVVEKIIASKQELSVNGYLPVVLSNNNYEFSSIHRNRGTA